MPDQPLTFTDAKGVQRYVESRYTTPRQRWVDERERLCLQRLLTQYIPPAQRAEVLDVPCGYGRILPLLTGLGYQYHWADVSPSMVERVGQRSDTQDQGSGTVAAVDNQPFADGSFSLTTTIRLFHHFHGPAERIAALRELARVSSGWVLVSFYTPYNLHRWTKRFFTLIQRRRSRISFISRRRFTAEVRQAGLEVVAMRAWAPLLHAHTFALLRPIGNQD